MSANSMTSTASHLLSNIQSTQNSHLSKVSSNPNFHALINRQSSKIHMPLTTINYED